MESKFKIGDKIKGIGINSDLDGVVKALSHSEDAMWANYGRSYVSPHYKVSIKLSGKRGIISWFHEGCFVLDKK